MKRVRGMRDLLPNESLIFEQICEKFRKYSKLNGCKFVELPIIEESSLFKRTAGEDSDICTKELFNVGRDISSDILVDSNISHLKKETDIDNDLCSENMDIPSALDSKNISKNKITEEVSVLRPEGTASCVRALSAANMISSNKILKIFYLGAMFRYNRPQVGRYRQFFQAGWEWFGTNEANSDAECIISALKFIESFDIKVVLEINSIGDINTRNNYRVALKEWMLSKNILVNKDPLKILDENLLDYQDIPNITNFLSKEDYNHFEKVKSLLDSANISYVHNPYLVRGLDYYYNTVFEIKILTRKSQATLIAGGRYDLSKQLTKNSVPAFGWAAGIDRIMLETSDFNLEKEVIIFALDSNIYALNIAYKLREYEISCSIIWGENLNKSFKKISNKDLDYIIIAGLEEENSNIITVKNLSEKTEEKMEIDQFIKTFKESNIKMKGEK